MREKYAQIVLPDDGGPDGGVAVALSRHADNETDGQSVRRRPALPRAWPGWSGHPSL